MAAIALPQYQFAVARAKYMQLVAYGESIVKAEQIYYLEHGTYTDVLADLPIETPAPVGIDIRFGVANPSTSYVEVQGNSTPHYLHYFQYGNSQRECRAFYSQSKFDLLKQVCEKVMGNTCRDIQSNYCLGLFKKTNN